jgi:hypothetical protein
MLCISPVSDAFESMRHCVVCPLLLLLALVLVPCSW